MRMIIKLFFRLVRLMLHPVMLAWEVLTTPRGIIRDPLSQLKVEDESRNLVLYQFKTCPFCIKVRREINRLSLPIEMRDAQKNQQNREELLRGGGQIKVPCLKIKDEQGVTQWMYESNEIKQYLHQRFADI